VKQAGISVSVTLDLLQKTREIHQTNPRAYNGAGRRLRCFGTIPINPWLSVSISVVSVLVVANWKGDKWRPITPTIAAIALSAMSAVLFAVLSLNTTTFNNLGEIKEGGKNKLVILEPKQWLGSRLPIEQHIICSDRILSGKWRLVFYHDNCELCGKYIESILSTSSGLPTVFIAVPPYKSVNRVNTGHVIWCKLTNGYEWFVQTPETLFLEDGIVIQHISRKEISGVFSSR